MEPIIIDPTAKQATFKTFYHYQSFCAEHLVTLLLDKKLYFSDPFTFNDPWDCKPIFRDQRLTDLQGILAESQSVRCRLTDYLAHFCSDYLAQGSAMRAMKCVGLPLDLANH
jgi:hypothetical protein